MCKFIGKHQKKTAYKIYQTLPKNKNTSRNVKIENLLSVMYNSILNDMYESSITFMQTWKNLGGSIKEDYFYQIFKAYGQVGQYEGIRRSSTSIIQNSF